VLGVCLGAQEIIGCGLQAIAKPTRWKPEWPNPLVHKWCTGGAHGLTPAADFPAFREVSPSFVSTVKSKVAH
jgi:hypothetical protein